MTAELELALLRHFEPVLRFTRGEQFFPIDVERYVQIASLWYQRPGEDAVCVLGQGEVTLDMLTRVDMGRPDAVYFLKFTEPLDATELAIYQDQRKQSSRAHIFTPGRGRLARVGYVSRFVEALFSVALLARGRVPGDTAAAATLRYEKLLEECEEYTYHGRVVHEAGWVVIQYWFFYVYNNWRSGFFGANDHEADWELVSIYLAERDDLPPLTDGAGESEPDLSSLLERYQPEWVAYASHDYQGDDLRRRWDDPELEKIDGHPVVYIGAGSHACYFRRGEYLTELELAFMQPLAKVIDWLQQFWYNQLKQYQDEPDTEQPEQASNLFRIPFVDYARGDGMTLGPQQEKQWGPPHVLSAGQSWVRDYRGLWGLYARDPFAGEDAPAGPMYNRDRTLRRSWYDPAGWAGLDKVAPADEELRLMVAQQMTLGDRQGELLNEIQQKAFELRNLGIAARAMRRQPHLHRLRLEYEQRIGALSTEVAKLREEMASGQALLGSLGDYAKMRRAGVRESPRAHIRHAHTPTADEQFRAGRLAEIWAAASIGLLLVVMVGIFYFARHYLVFGISALIALFAFVEATFRGRIVRMVTSVTIGLAVVAALILIYEFFWLMVALTVVVIASYLLWDNLRELWS
ncbi:MAG: hypothetical protein IT328_03705 [Caldilineaceae bacterium]|nr:hypothetical protein [Caldilineaceae bacterium]